MANYYKAELALKLDISEEKVQKLWDNYYDMNNGRDHRERLEYSSDSNGKYSSDEHILTYLDRTGKKLFLPLPNVKQV